MRRYRRDRGPRAHWLLLAMGLLLLIAELSLYGFVHHAGAEGAGPAGRAGQPAPAAPAEVTGGGPVVRVDRDGTVTTRRMPARTVALTFDDGPDPRWTPQVLEVLRRHRAQATFFVVGSRVNDHPDLVRRMVADGHELGSHTFTHANLSALPRWQRRLELTFTANAIAAATGRRVAVARPPYSSTPDAVTGPDFAVFQDAGAAGHLVVLTDLDPQDWRTKSPADLLRAATPTGTSGAVVMLHDGGGDRTATVLALDALLTDLGERGYRFTTVSAASGLAEAGAADRSARIGGTAMRWAQRLSYLLVRTMNVLLVVALGLALLRLLTQLTAARVHARLARRRRTGRLRYLGPVSIIVPAYNEAANIAATVRSLVASDYPRLEVIVVDDGSTDGTAAIVRRLGLPGVRLLRQPNAGKPAALNRGIFHAAADIVILVDGDTVFEPDAVGRLVQPFVDGDVGAVSGNTRVANRRGLLGRWQHLEYVIGFNLDRRLFDLGECMPTVPGAIGAFRRRMLLDLGGVPAVTLAEDTDLTMAVLRAGWRVVYEPSAVAWTEVPATLRQLWRQRYRWCYGTMQAMWRHRRAIRERGRAGRLGRRGLVYLLIFQVLLPLTAPAVDVYAVYGLAFLPIGQVALVWLGFLGVQVLTAGYALRLDRERLTVLWALPLQQVVYRQLMYLVVVQSTVTALLGGRLRWRQMVRTGTAAAALRKRPGSLPASARPRPRTRQDHVAPRR